MTGTQENPFHEGERAAQERAGVGDVSAWAGGFIRDHLPSQHRAFHTALPFLVLAGADGQGQVWATILDGAEGFITSPDARHLTLATSVEDADPLAGRFAQGGDIGGLGIELASRRRNRFSGHIAPGAEGFTISMRQTFGNCPQYIHPRGLRQVTREPGEVARNSVLSDAQIALIERTDTLFIGSGHDGREGAASNGYDASHRGGAPGFVHVESPTRLLLPDYAGNNFFNTIGNLMADPRVGLLFVDFKSGGLLHLTGRAHIDWSPRDAHDTDAWRMIRIDIEAVIERPAALGLRWHALAGQARHLCLTRRVKEADHITSFYFAPLDDRPLAPFAPGQHLPIAVQIPGQAGMTARSYSLSGDPADRSAYRLSIKREERGLMSRHLHDALWPGKVIEALPPAGEFGLPEGDEPVVLISAGVGLTPMLSMLHALAGTGRPACYVHAAKNARERAMGAEVRALVTAHETLRSRVYFSEPTAEDRLGRDYDVEGVLTAEAVIALAGGNGAHFLLCGPPRFLSDIRSGLEQHGIAPGHIHFETFGPG